MGLALRLARKGLYTTDPNPRVGCVIAAGGRIVGRGWHRRAGGPHAEVVALGEAGERSRGATAYVTLEPCSHHGQTPPCADALLDAGVSRVVVAVQDPNPAVDGGGRARLLSAGVEVETGLMAEPARQLNAGFFKRMETGMPWLRIKSAISLDGRTALQSRESKWISSEASRRDVQRWRARSSGILTGIGTVLADDPEMNARVPGDVAQPLRVVADRQWRTPPASRILVDPGTALVAGDESRPVPQPLSETGVRLLPLPSGDSPAQLSALLLALGEMQLNEVQVEAGARLCGALLAAGLVDEFLIYQAPLLLGEGGPGPVALGPLESMGDRTHLQVLETRHVGNDLRIRLQAAESEAGP